MINGLLIEGVDYAGKTSLAEALNTRLKQKGIKTKYQKYYLTDNKATQLLVKEGDALSIGEKQDFMYTMATLLDIKEYKAEPDTFLLQDRHWLSIVAHNKFFYPESEIANLNLLEKNHEPFKFNLYLTSDLEEKLKRISACPPKSSFDRYLVQNPTIHQSYDKFWIECIPKHENWLILDTTNKSLEKVADEVESFISYE